MIIDFFAIVFLAFTLLLLVTAMISLFLGVPYVPTRKKVVQALIKLIPKRKNMKVYDLGCGDGRLLFALEKEKGIAGKGYELAPLVFIMAIIKKWITRSKVQIRCQNFFRENLKDANLILCYLTPEILEKLGQKLKRECEPGTLIISHTFAIKNMKPKRIRKKNREKGMPAFYLYEL